MGTSASKPARSAAQAASRRQYPKQPTSASPIQSTKPPPPPPQTSRPPPGERRPPPPGPKYHSKEQPSTTKSAAIDLDGRDPDFAASLRSIGPVTPAPTLSHSSTVNTRSVNVNPSGSGTGTGILTGAALGPTHGSIFPAATPTNPAMLVITARQQIAKRAEAEAEMVGKGSFAGREFLDAVTIRQVLGMRDRQGLEAGEIERMLRLKGGVVGSLGGRGVVGEV